ncbi:MAG: FHA domain-containing protein [Gemmataceae bacterium]|nr:FHA domain-containing protein [Gemmataceae bacterium]
MLTPTPSVESFHEAVGLDGPLSLTVVGPTDADRHVVRLPGPFAVIGADPRCDLVLADERVSGRHAYLQVLGGRLYALDLGSRTGVFQGHSRISGAWLRADEFLRIGPYHIRCAFTPAAGAASEGFPPEDPVGERIAGLAGLPQLSADIALDGSVRTQWRVNRCLAVIGRSSEARLKLHDLSVSNFHCCLVTTPSGTWVVDLRSREGTRSNGAMISSAPVREGDALGIGPCEIRFRRTSSHSQPVVTVLAPAEKAALARRSALVDGDQPGGPLVPVPAPMPGLPVPAADPLLLPILQQVGLMQQQMMDQFQQTMMMMMGVIQRLHGEQAELAKREMQRLRETNLELHEALLKRETEGKAQARKPASRPASRPVAAASAPAAPSEGQPAAPVLLPEGKSGAEIHGALSDRIAELESKRKGIWERLLGLMGS